MVDNEIIDEKNQLSPSENTETAVTVVESDDLIRKTAEELSLAIAKAETKEELEALYQKFNINNTKKNALRINQLNDLLDQVNSEAIDRFNRRPSEISNKEILDYMNAIQNQIERSQKTVEGIKDITAVQVNNTQNNTVNIHVGTEEIPYLSKASRDRITDLVATILKENSENIILDISKDNSEESSEPVKPDTELKTKKDIVIDAVVDSESDDFIGDE